MLAISEKDLTKLLHSLDHNKSHLLLQHLSTALRIFSAQRKKNTATAVAAAATATNTQNTNIIHQPARTSIINEKWGATTLFMPVSDHQSTGFKVVTVPSVSTATNAIRGVVNILSPEGRLEGVLSAAEITAFRTALASMIPFSRFSSSSSSSSSSVGGISQKGNKRILIFGSGKQAEWHARLALLTVSSDPTDIVGVTFVNRSRQRLEESIWSKLVPDLRERYPHLEINAYSREELQGLGNGGGYETRLRADLARSDAIFCCTPSTEPLFTYDDLTTTNSNPKKRRFISLIGSYKPHMQEVDSRTLLSGANGKIYVDSVEACMEEAGELIRAKVDETQLIELGELDTSLPPAAKETEDDEEGNVIFKCVGLGIMDLVIARSLLEMAKEQGLGTVVDGF